MRRIVTGHDEQGRPTVLLADEPPTVMDFGPIVTTEIWVTDSTPPDLAGQQDASLRPWALDPPARGTAFRVVRFLPETETPPAVADEAGSEEPEFLGEHGTRTLDYVVVLSGRIMLTVGGRSIELGPGDCVVQRGTEHAWTVRGSEPCVVAGVLVSARDQ